MRLHMEAKTPLRIEQYNSSYILENNSFTFYTNLENSVEALSKIIFFYKCFFSGILITVM